MKEEEINTQQLSNQMNPYSRGATGGQIHIEFLLAENKRLIRERNYYKRKYREIENSKSWRYTRVLRSIIHKCKVLLKLQDTTEKGNQSKIKGKNKKKNRQVKLINHIRGKLYSLGFSERPWEELKELAFKSPIQTIRQSAAWELALWYADIRTKEAAKNCLELLEMTMKDKTETNYLREYAILSAECHEILDNIEEARTIILNAITIEKHPDLYVAAANYEESLNERLKWINKIMDMYDLSHVEFDNSISNSSIYDGLKCIKRDKTTFNEHTSNPTVTVIIPVYNAENVIETAINSVLNQTWSNLEVIVVDDCSTDNTVRIIEKYAERDGRIRLIKAHTNGGTYVARNLGLKAASGEYVTCHDADDWSHSQKIERQVLHLLDNPQLIGNTTSQFRATEDFKFPRRNSQRFYISPNLSSLMFRRIPVMEALGFWDSVRFGGDGELLRRIRKVFGDKAVVNLDGPLSFPRLRNDSLTGSSKFGFQGHYFGARKEYVEAFTSYHSSGGNLKYPFPQEKRIFPVPYPMLHNRIVGENRHFDVIIVSDFRLPGGTTSSNIEEIKAQKKAGLKTGLIQMSRYTTSSIKGINQKIRDLIDGDQVQMLVYGETVYCDNLIIRHPPILQEKQEYIPNVVAKNISIIINQTPLKDYGDKNSEVAFDIIHSNQRVIDYFGHEGIWYPIGPQVRKTLMEQHLTEINKINLSTSDWVNIIDVNEWKRKKRPDKKSKIRIGRHSRDMYVKWPPDPNQLLEIYPNSDEYEIHVLGGAKTPEETLGELPPNWRVYQFGEMSPTEFLKDIDVFVYYTHPDCIEAFGRVIFEAMSAGVPVIIPYSYKELFGNSAIYAEPSEVQKKVQLLMSDPNYYNTQVEIALNYVEENFGYTKHINRLKLRQLQKSM
ncbi:Hyaluronan synthase [Chlamydia abortus]|uniref:glycosyltransferase n=1 Tax=Paenibacillus sp. SAFN-117 TaxID=3436860 RepID=UPI000A27AC8A|nr:Hyaluronan synthase [Chlamydia abortus]